MAQQSIRLLMRADDMGISHDVNLAIIKAHKEGIITSASVMPTSDFFDEAVKLCNSNPSMVTGVHITLAASKLRTVLSPEIVPSLVTPRGFLYETAEELINAKFNIEEMEKEIRAQVRKAKTAGLKFTYLDYHRGVPEEAKQIIIKICNEQKLVYGQDRDGSIYGYYRIVVMPETWPYQIMPDKQRIYLSAPEFTEAEKKIFFDTLRHLAPGNWITAVHPGLTGPQRSSVTELLCSSEAKKIIKQRNIQLISYYDIWLERYGKKKIKTAD